MNDEQKLMWKNPTNYVSNPLNAVLLIKRLSFDIMHIQNQIMRISEEFRMHTENITLPYSDFEGAVEGLIRLQTTYNLKPEDLAKGVIEDKKYRDDLTANELFAIGGELMNSNRILSSLSYLNLALEKNKETSEMPQRTILEFIYQNYNKTDDKKGILATVEKMIELEPERLDLQELKTSLELKSIFEEPQQEKVLEEEKTGQFSAFKEFKLINQACRNELRKSDEELSKLFCRFVSNSAFSKLAPFKVEEANLDPYIAIYHDVISDAEIKDFKKFSTPSLERAKVLNLDASSRVSNFTFAMS